MAKIEAMAAEKGCTPAQLTLAWLLAQGPDVVAIPGTRYVKRLDENLGALRVTLSPEDVAAHLGGDPAGAAAGTRYPAGGMKVSTSEAPDAIAASILIAQSRYPARSFRDHLAGLQFADRVPVHLQPIGEHVAAVLAQQRRRPTAGGSPPKRTGQPLMM